MDFKDVKLSESLSIFDKPSLSAHDIQEVREIRVPYVGSSPNVNTLQFRYDSASTISLDRSFLAVKGKFQLAAGGDVLEGRYALAQGGWGLFGRSAILLHDQEVESVMNPGDVNAILGLAYKTKDKLEAEAFASGFFPNRYALTTGVPRCKTTADQTDIVAASGLNPVGSTWYADGADIDTAFSLASQQFVTDDTHLNKQPWMILPLKDVFGVANISKLLPRARVQLTLERQTDVNKFITGIGSDNAAAEAVVFQITDAYLNVCEVVPNQKAFLPEMERLAKGQGIPLNFLSRTCEPIALGNTASISKEIVSAGRRVKHLFLLNQRDTMRSGIKTYKHSPGADIEDSTAESWTNMSLSVNGISLPRFGAYSGVNTGYTQEYRDFLKFGGKLDSGLIGSAIDINTWKRCYPIVYFNLEQLPQDQMNSMDTRMNLMATFGSGQARTGHVCYLWEQNFVYDPSRGSLQVVPHKM